MFRLLFYDSESNENLKKCDKLGLNRILFLEESGHSLSAGTVALDEIEII